MVNIFSVLLWWFACVNCAHGWSRIQQATQIAAKARAVAEEQYSPVRLIATFNKEFLGKREDILVELSDIRKRLRHRLRREGGDENWRSIALPSSGIGIIQLPHHTLPVVQLVVTTLMENSKILAVESDSVVVVEDYGVPSYSASFSHELANGPSNLKTPNDVFWHEMWNMNDIQAPGAWAFHTGREDNAFRPIVSVIDSGVQYDHPDLAPNMWVNEAELNGLPGVDDDENGYVDDIYGWNPVTDSGYPYDDHGHGTKCAGIVGAVGNNAEGVAGVNWAPLIQPCKFIKANGYGVTSDALICLDYAVATGAHITTNSWGGGSFLHATINAIQRVQDAGIIFVAASGNNGRNTDSEPFYPASYSLPNIISVAAIDSDAELASFSNYGVNTTDICAPGMSVPTTKLGNGYVMAKGTSMAAPHVSGVLSLMKSMDPSLTSKEMIDILKQTVAPIADPNVVKWGGKVNAHGALQKVSQRLAATSPTTTTTTSTTTTTTTTTTTSTTSTTSKKVKTQIAIGLGTDTCVKVCDKMDGTCHEEEMIEINTNFDLCFKRLSDFLVGAPISAGSSVPHTNYFPKGCFMHTSMNVYLNTIDDGELGCLAAPGENNEARNLCICEVPA